MSESTICIIVFILVFGSFLFSQMLFVLHEERQYMEKPKNIPALFRLAYVPIMAISLMFGEPMARMFPTQTKRIENWIAVADLSLNAAFVYSARLFYIFLLGIIAVFLPLPILLKVVALLFAVVIGWCYPEAIVQSKAKDRQEEILRGLPYAMDLIISAMRSGLDFGAALQYYVKLNLDTPLTKEFGRVLEETRLGETREKALEAMADRIHVQEFTTVVGSITHGMEVGSSISESLAIQGDELRRARFNAAEQKAARAPSIMLIPMLILIVPAVFIIMATPVLIKVLDTGLLKMF